MAIVEVGPTPYKTAHHLLCLAFLVFEAIEYCLTLNQFEGPLSLIALLRSCLSQMMRRGTDKPIFRNCINTHRPMASKLFRKVTLLLCASGLVYTLYLYLILFIYIFCYTFIHPFPFSLSLSLSLYYEIKP